MNWASFSIINRTLPVAVKLFRQSLALAAELGCSLTAWVATRANLAHALRRLGRLDEALAEFDQCLRTISGGSLSQPLNDLSRRIESYNSGPSGLADSAGGGGAGAVAGYDDRNLIGSIHTSRGLVLLSMPSRTHEAVLALHEAVRVLGGDASGGGVAGTLLGRAVEIWALEEGGDDSLASQRLGTPRATQSPKRRRHVWNGNEGEDTKTNDGISTGRKVELGLDDAADEVLGAALGNSVREWR